MSENKRTTNVEQPITDQDDIADILETVGSGDELTIECAASEDKSTYRDNREVVFRDNAGVQFGDPILEVSRVLAVRNGVPKAYELNRESEEPPLVNGREITKLWVWGE